MKNILKRVPRPVNTDDDSKFDLEQVIKDVSTLVSIASMGPGRNRLATTMAMTTAGLTVASIVRHVYSHVQKVVHGGEYTLKLVEHDLLFQFAESWLMDALPEDKKLSVFVKSSLNTDRNGNVRSLSWKSTYDGSIEQEVEIEGHTVRVSTEKPESEAKGNNDRMSRMSERTIVFTCPSAAARDAVRDELVKRGQLVTKNSPGFHTARWGSFDRNCDISHRTKESVFLKEGQMDRIINHIKRFQSNEAEYDRYGIPFRTGIMMYGTPGSGKTSTATVLANEMNMDIYYVSIRSMDGDQEFENIMSKVPENAIVVLEDIDAVNAAKDRDSDNDSTEFVSDVSMTALLNVLDGMQSPRGVVFIMTTNKRERLDEAILRPGRVDLMEELNAIDTYQLRTMLEHYSGESYADKYVPELSPEHGITTAEIMQVIRKHLPHREQYAEAVLEYIEAKLLTSSIN
jgi:hypothetical protein